MPEQNVGFLSSVEVLLHYIDFHNPTVICLSVNS